MVSAQDELVRLATDGVGDALSATGIGSRILQFGGKAASLGLSAADRQEGQEALYRKISLHSPQEVSGTVQLALDTTLAAEPELFYGPFLQLGTYLDIENPVMRLGLDIVADPLTWVPVDLGLGKLNKVGRLGELLSSVTRGGKFAMTPEKALAKVEQTLDVFGKIAGNPELRQQLVSSSRKLTSGEFNRLIKTIDTSTTPPGVKQMIDTLGRNRKAFKDLLSLAANEKTAQRALQGGDLLQPTFLTQLKAGQRTIVEFHKPFTVTKAWLGTGYKDHVLWRPTFPAMFVPESAARRLSGEATAKVAAGLHPDFNIDAAFQPDLGKTYSVSFEHADSALTTLEALLAPTGPAMVLGDAVSDASILDHYRTFHKPNVKPDFLKTETGARFKAEYIRNYGEMRSTQAAAASQARDIKFKQAEASVGKALKSAAPDTMSPSDLAKLTEGQTEGLGIWQRGATPEEIVNDIGGPGLGLEAAHKADRRQVANTGITIDELFRKNFVKPAEREKMQALFGHMVSHPDLFRVDAAGRGVLARAGDVAKESPLLANFLKKNPDVAKFITEKGVPAEITQLSARVTSFYEAVGAQQFTQEFTIPEFLGNYIPRRGRFTREGRKHLKMDLEAGKATEGSLLVNPSAEMEREIDNLLRAERATEGKATHEKYRKLVESQLAAWEEKGWFVRETDPVKILTEYADAAAMSSLHNRLFNELPELTGRVSPVEKEKFVRGFGIPDADFERLSGGRRLSYKRPKDTTHWKEIGLGKRHGASSIDEAAEFANLSKPEVRETLRLQLADELAGATEVQGVKVTRKAQPAGFVDTRGSGKQYHGSAEPLQNLGEGYYSGRNIYGEGLYTTDDVTTGAKYPPKNAQKGQASNPTVSEIVETQPVKFYDLDAPIDDSVRPLLSEQAKHSESFDSAMRDVERGEVKTLAEFMDAVRGYSRNAGESSDEITEIFSTLTYNLEKAGYGGFTHQGGKLAGGGKRTHQVKIYWHPETQISAKPINLKDVSIPSASEPVQLQAGWIRANSFPDSIDNVMEVKAAVKRELAARESALSEKIAQRRADLASGRLKKGKLGKARREARPDTLWVLKPYASEITNAFRFFGREGLSSGKGWRHFDALNSRLKGLVLAVDAFHGNVLTAASMIANPKRMAQVLSMGPEIFDGGLAAARAARVGFIPRTAAGAAVGALGAAGLGADDPGEIAAGGLAGALWANAFTAALRNGILHRKIAMTPGVSRIQAYAGMVWNGHPNDRYIGILGRGLRSMADSLRRSGASEALISPIEGLRHVEDMFQETLWGVMHNGAKETYFAARFAQEDAKLAAKGGGKIVNGLDQELLAKSREIMASSDTFFGGQNMGRLFVKPEMQQFLRRALLSPDWTSARLLGGANMMLNMTAPAVLGVSAAGGTLYELAANGFDIGGLTGTGTVGGAGVGLVLQKWAQRVNARMATKGDIMAREARKLYGAAILGGFFMGNLLNYAFNGRWMWENDHGDQLKVVTPDGSRIAFGKAYKEIFEFSGADPHYGVPVQARLASKLSVPIKAGIEVLTNRSWNGPIIQADASIAEKAGSAASWAIGTVTPIVAAGPTREASAFIGGSRTAGQAATIAALRGVGLGVAPPPRRTPVEFSALQSAIGGLHSLGEASIGSLLSGQRNLR